MKPAFFHDLDVLIDSALASEAMRPVPKGLEARIEQRLTIAALIEKERRSCREAALACAGFLAVIVAGGVTFLSMVDLPLLIARSMPGGLGYCDYLAVSASQIWADFIGSSYLGWLNLAIAFLLTALAASLRKTPALHS
jgi:hypothetical protein